MPPFFDKYKTTHQPKQRSQHDRGHAEHGVGHPVGVAVLLRDERVHVAQNHGHLKRENKEWERKLK